MSENNNCTTKEKWEKTGLLDSLSDERANKIAHLFENQARYLMSTFSDRDIPSEFGFLNRSFAIIRDVFDRDDLSFTFEATNLPAFIYAKEGQTDEEGAAMTTTPHVFDTQPTGEDDAIIAEIVRKELNSRYAGKHLIFGAPLVDVNGFGCVCAAVDGGSRLVFGGYEK
jgi:hypothetical protein